MTVKQSLVGIALLLVSSAVAVIIAVRFGRHQTLSGSVEAQAQVQTPPQVKTVVLAKDQKLKDADWHCYAGGWCELWTLTQPRKAENKPETYLYQNEDGSRQFIIKEQ